MINRFLKQVFNSTFFLIMFAPCVLGQIDKSIGYEIKNNVTELRKAKVKSILYTTFYYKDKKSKSLSENGLKQKMLHFDTLGRNVEVIYYNDSTGITSGRSRYFYSDSSGIGIYRIENYDKNDSLLNISEAEMRDGKFILIRMGGVSSCFGHYKFKYNSLGLIDEAVWYGPKVGSWANKNMIPYHVTKLTYYYSN